MNCQKGHCHTEQVEAVLPDQPNQRPPRGLSTACSATASPQAAGATEDDAAKARDSRRRPVYRPSLPRLMTAGL